MSRTIIRKTSPIISRLIEIGRCYKGSPKGTSKRGYAGGDDYASHYFRFEPEERLKLHPSSNGAHANLYEELKAAWEAMMKEGHIKIRFPHPTIAENFPYSNKVYKKIGSTEKTFRECDGQTCTKWVESAPHPSKPGQTIPVFKRGARPCAAVDGKTCPEGCEAKGMIKFMVPDLYPGGIILFPLNSPVDIGAIAGYLEPYAGYDLSAIPFNLFRQEDKIDYEEKGEMKQKRNWGLHLGIDPTITRLMMESRSRNFISQLEGNPQPVLPQRTQAVAALPQARSESGLQDFRTSDDYFHFERAVSAAIRNRSNGQLKEAVDNARELIYAQIYDQSGHWAIDKEEQRALEALQDVSYPAPAISHAVPASPDLEGFDRAAAYKAIGKELKRLNWSSDASKEYTTLTYTKSSVKEMPPEDLVSYLEYLSGLSPDQAASQAATPVAALVEPIPANAPW